MADFCQRLSLAVATVGICRKHITSKIFGRILPEIISGRILPKIICARSVTHITYKTRVSITDMYFRNYSIGPTDLFKVFPRIFIHYRKSLNVIRKPLIIYNVCARSVQDSCHVCLSSLILFSRCFRTCNPKTKRRRKKRSVSVAV